MEKNILQVLIDVSEKSANVARAFRENGHLFSLLQEKLEEEANPRFVHDYKTFADVLIQELIKFEVGNAVSIVKILIFI